MRIFTALLISALVNAGFCYSQDNEGAVNNKPGFGKLKEFVSGFHGFGETGYGGRLKSDDRQKHTTIYHEYRFQLEYSKRIKDIDLRYKSDMVYDAWKGAFIYDLREANAYLYPFDWMDIKAGRQILTWGTGDFLFLNDLFPKDYQSFFIGREDEYLKAPSTSIKTSFYPEIFKQSINIDFVWTPVFEHDRFITGERLSYYNNLLNDKAGFKNKIHYENPDRTLRNSEYAARISKNFSGIDSALYFYKGFFHQPLAFDFDSHRSKFPELAVYGGSVQGAIFGGVGNFEIAYYDSMDDTKGDDPFVENSYLKGLIGYNRELMKNLTFGTQYFVELMSDYDEYKKTYPVTELRANQARQVITFRLTQLMFMENLKLSVFTFYSPNDEDTYIRPNLSYKWSDNLMLTIGGNIFAGKEEHTFFGQFEDNTNIYGRIRYSF